MEFSVAVIGTCGEEIVKDFIGVRCTDQFGDRNAHVSGIISSKDIAEVAGWNIYIDWITVLDLAVMNQ